MVEPCCKGHRAGGSRKPKLEEAAGLQESSGAESDAAGAPPGDVVLLHVSSPGESVLGRSPELRKAHQV